jgi:4-hydroxy-tetrahydrodipicolinate synthase
MASFTGIWAPLVTPFCDNGSVDIPALKALSSKLLAQGLSGLVVCGSTGEAAAQSPEEQLATLDAVLEVAPKEKVVMGLSGNNLPQVLARLRQLEQRAPAGLLVTPPYYIKPSQAGIIDYFHAIADTSSLPIILYNIPSRTGVNMEAATIIELAKHERIVAIKDCGNDMQATVQVIADGKLQVLAGDDYQMLSTMALGGTGAIAATAHIRPDLFAAVARNMQQGNVAQARDIFYRLLPWIRAAFEEPNPAPAKAALAMQGLCKPHLRAPMQAATPAMQDKLRQILTKLEAL